MPGLTSSACLKSPTLLIKGGEARWPLHHVVDRRQEVEDPAYRRWFYLGTALALWVTWQITTGAGVLLGAQLPESWSLDFAIPLVFLTLMATAVRS